jgi:hypothetical protein
MWRNVEMDAFIDWLRAHNAPLDPKRRLVAQIAIVVFLLLFVPVPVSL